MGTNLVINFVVIIFTKAKNYEFGQRDSACRSTEFNSV